LVRRLQPDIVHTHNPKPGVIGRPVARLLSVPLVVNTQHGLYAQPGDRRRRRWPVYAAERFAAAFSHIELVQSSEDVDTLVQRLRVPARKVRLLGNGIDLARFDPTAVPHHARQRLRREWGVGDGDVLIGAVCRLTREKGIEELLAAFETVREHCPNAYFVVIGPDELGDDLAPAIEVARNAGVVFTGLRTDMPECYAAMDVFVTASWREGVPRSAMEASAMRLPIVATDIRGCRQVVDANTTGTLVPVRHPAALAQAITDLTNDAELRHRYGTAAQARAQAEFDDRQVIERTLEAYRLLGH
jgi:glycosyltransferase involved in cell wall biosynthesis